MLAYAMLYHAFDRFDRFWKHFKMLFIIISFDKIQQKVKYRLCLILFCLLPCLINNTGRHSEVQLNLNVYALTKNITEMNAKNNNSLTTTIAKC